MEPEGSLPHSHEPATCPCSEPDEYSCSPIPRLKEQFLYYPTFYVLVFKVVSFCQASPTETLDAPPFSNIHYYYYYYYHVYAEYLQLCTTNCVSRVCSVAVFTICATCNVISLVKYVLYFYIGTFRSMCAVPNMAVFCIMLLLLLSLLLIIYLQNCLTVNWFHVTVVLYCICACSYCSLPLRCKPFFFI